MGIVTDGLVGYWHYQQGVSGSTWENIAPDTVGQYNGQINGAVLQSDGMYFDGVDDFISMPALPLGTVQEVEIIFNISRNTTHSVYGYLDTQTFSSCTLSYQNGLIAGAKNSYGSFPLNVISRVNHSLNGQTEKVFVQNIQRAVGTTPSPIPAGTFNRPWNLGNRLGDNNSTKGIIISVKLYSKELTSQERTQNLNAGTSIGLTEEPPVSNPPAVTIVNISAPTADNTLSDEPNMDRATITFKFDQDVTEWRVRTIGTDPETGILADSGGAVSAGTEITAEVDWTELYGEGQNRVNIYGKNADGLWTPYG